MSAASDSAKLSSRDHNRHLNRESILRCFPCFSFTWSVFLSLQSRTVLFFVLILKSDHIVFSHFFDYPSFCTDDRHVLDQDRYCIIQRDSPHYRHQRILQFNDLLLKRHGKDQHYRAEDQHCDKHKNSISFGFPEQYILISGPVFHC